MSRRKKLVICVLTVVTLAVVGYFSTNLILDRVSRRATQQLVTLARQQGIEVVDPDFRAVRISGWIAATWWDAQARFKLHRDDLPGERRWQATAERLRIKWSTSGLGTLSVDRVVIVGDPPTLNNTGDSQPSSAADRRIELNDVRCQFPMELLDPSATVRRLTPEFSKLAATAKTTLPLDLSGTLSFSIRSKPAEVGIFVHRADDVSSVELKAEDVQQLSERFDEALTPAEAELVARHSLRAIRLLQIKDRAESISAQAHHQDAAVPQDAYRHVLWSFLLTREYGADFAQQVGAAHETGDTGNTAAERQMDLHNNAIGRRYARDKLPEANVLPRLLRDPNVIRAP